jgi:hypothetical protein
MQLMQSLIDTSGNRVVPTEVKSVVLTATCSMEAGSNPPSDITDEQICFKKEASAVSAVFVISYLKGKIAVVI